MTTERFTLVLISMNAADAKRTSDNVVRLGRKTIYD